MTSHQNTQQPVKQPLLTAEENDRQNGNGKDSPRGSDYIPESQRYSIKFDFLNEGEPKEEEPFDMKKVYIGVGVTLAVVFLLWIIYKIYGAEIFAFLYQKLEAAAQDASFFNTLVLLLSQVIYGWIPIFPGISTFNIMMAFLMKSFWRPFLISFIGGYLASLSVVYVVRNYLRNKVVEQFKNKVIFAIVYLAVKRNPVRMGILVNFLFLPPSGRNYLCALTSIPFEQYLYAVLPGHLTYCFMFSLIGYTATDLNTFFHDKPFSEKSFAEKLQKVLTYFMLLLTVGIMVFFGYLAKKMYAEFEENLKKDAEFLKKKREREMRTLESPEKPAPKQIDVLV